MANGAVIVASCKPIVDDDSDPPCIRAKREYQSIVDDAKGAFYCTGEYRKPDAVEPLEFTQHIGRGGRGYLGPIGHLGDPEPILGVIQERMQHLRAPPGKQRAH